jgi:DNA-binding transcriptional ArsR family regulator
MDIFSALAEPSRRSIIELLAKKGKLSSTDISSQFQISAPAISQHLKVLKEANLVKMEKRAQQHLYQINPDKMHELEEWIKKLSRLWDDRFLALDKVLEAEKKKLKKKGGGR